MGIDIKKGGRIKSRRNKKVKTNDLYKKLLIKLFKFLLRRTHRKIHKDILHRLFLSRVNNPAISISRIAKNLKRQPNLTAVTVCKVTNDERLL